MNINLFDLLGQDREIAAEMEAAVQQVLRSGQFILGPHGKALEEEIASLCDVEHGIGVASGTDALILALRALDVGPGDEVIAPPFTFGATAGTIAWVGAKPVFADIAADTFNLDVNDVAAKITPETKAVIAVHLFGLPADMDALNELCRERGVALIEDAAQAIGARYKGRPIGGLADIATFSFYPTKNLGGYGDGGLVTTPREDLASRVRELRAHGSARKYIYDSLGTNSRLDEIQAAILRVKLTRLSDWTEKRRRLAAVYREELDPVGGITIQSEPEGYHHVYHLLTLLLDDPDALQRDLGEHGIGSGRYYPMGLHLMPAFSDRGYVEGDFPVTEETSRRCLSVPAHPALTEEQARDVASRIRSHLSVRG